jgi:hypothetical protein
MFSFAIYDDLIATLQKEIADRSEIIASGTCGSFEDYRFGAGGIAGLKTAIELIEEFRIKYMES